MGKYVFAYRGGGMAQTDEARQAAMAAWGAWFGKIGSAIVDPGNPFAGSTSVGGNGNAESALTGYTVVKADSLDAASGLADGCPVLDEGGSIDVYETVEVSL
ncbi:MAG TPA: hypothetical protein VGH21_06105 [Solirubrobacteraceae bacterium]